ncbi:MAG: thioredoxin family protein [Candidatus Eisenbacteria bacterium]|nr:thioredoxin family protein [Candidatus Eisenbacteria bacterium]
MRRVPDRFSKVWAGTAIVLALTSILAAKPAGSDPNAWRLVNVYEVTHSLDKTWSAQVFQSKDFKHLLVLPETGLDAWALDLMTLKGYQLAVTEIGLTEGKARVPSLARRVPVAELHRQEAKLSFDVADGTITMTPGELLVGEVSLSLLLKRRPDYLASAARYMPDPNAVAILKTRKSPAEIYVVFGTWCSVCKRVVPTIIRTMELAANPAIKVRYVAIDEDKSQPAGLLKALAVKTTPTIVVRAGGKEIGRLAGPPTQAIERELVNLLTKAP